MFYQAKQYLSSMNDSPVSRHKLFTQSIIEPQQDEDSNFLGYEFNKKLKGQFKDNVRAQTPN
jgi:hypothetical protein